VAKDLHNNPVVMRGEMVFVGGALMRQVMTLDELRSRVSAFFVDEAAATIWLHTSPGLDPAKVTIEAAVRPRLLETSNVNHVTLRHLSFIHAACHLQEPGVQISGEGNVLIEDCAFNWNSWTGLGLAESHDVTLKNIRADHNGGCGFGGWRVKNLTADTLEASYNNWRGDWGGFHSWCVGQKFMSLHGGKFTNYVAHDNLGPALWFDTDDIDITVDHAVLDNNYNQGLFMEASPGPETFRQCTITRNGETGILATNTANVTIDHCTIAGNRQRQVFVPWQATAHSVLPAVTNYETKQAADMRSEHWTLTNNVIAGQGPQQLMVISKWPWFLSTVKLSGNAWHQTDREDVFAIFNASLTEPIKTAYANWCNWTGEDASSTFDHNPLPVELKN